MIPVSRAAHMRSLDAAVIDGLGLPGVALMELASAAVARVARDLCADGRILVLCGPGNNGGDGWAAARWLHGWGLDVAVWPLGLPSGGDAAIMARAAQAAGVPVVDEAGAPDLVVDAWFGTGLARPLDGEVLARLRVLEGRRVIAVDVPSGLDADTGEVLGAALRADVTVTFGRPKLGMFLGAGPEMCGRVEVIDIGLGAATPDRELAAAFVVEPGDVPWPTRPIDAHKGGLGHLLVVAGSAAMAGAGILCCRGALAAGAGLVTLVAPWGALARLAGLPPEVMVLDGGPGDCTTNLPDPDRFDGVVVGPGLAGGVPMAGAMGQQLRAWWRTARPPMIYDADALTFTLPTERSDRVLTPHEGEAARLVGRPASAVRRDRLGTAQELSARGVTLLKGRYTLVAGGITTINPTGAPTLATGGSGDVLAGMIGALLARGLPAERAARTAAYAHGRAGQHLAERRPDGWTASDIAAAVAATSSGT